MTDTKNLHSIVEMDFFIVINSKVPISRKKQSFYRV